MNRSMKRCFLLVLGLILIITGVPAGAEPGPEEVFAEQMLVGRLFHVEGQVLRFDPEENDWIPAVEDTLFGLEDVLYSERGARAEIIAPNNTWVRIGSDTRIQLIELKDAFTHVRVPSGIARFYNKGSYPVIKAGTPYGSVTAPAETCFEVHVTVGNVEVKSLKGTVYFTHRETNKKYEVIAWAASLVSDDRSIAAGKGYGEPVWEVWNRERDALWAGRMNAHVKSAKYMPSGLHDHAYLLEENGVWEPVYYGGHLLFLAADLCRPRVGAFHGGSLVPLVWREHMVFL